MNCRIDNSELIPLFSLGDIAVSDFVRTQENNLKSPLNLCIGEKSGLVQLDRSVDCDLMYQKYWYQSGTNESMRQQLGSLMHSVRLNKPNIDLWVDIGSNDNTLLSYISSTTQTVGFDPSDIALENQDLIDYFIPDYFSAKNYPPHLKKADVITAVAMFYDLDNPALFLNDVKECLEDDGVFVVQMSYLPLMLQQLAFDNICHEHITYYSFTVLKNLFNKCGFKIVDVKLNDSNGGSFRVYAQKTECTKRFGNKPLQDVSDFRIESLLLHEQTLNLDKRSTYSKFYSNINILKNQLKFFLNSVKQRNQTVWGYGASTKGNTLLQFFDINNTLLECIVETQSKKFGLKTVETNIPIIPESEIYKNKKVPDYLLVLPWHFIQNFVNKEIEYLKSGGKFIVPCPEFKVISYDDVR